MDTRPSTLDVTDKPIPVTNRRRVWAFIIAGFLGLGLGLIGGIIAGAIGFLIGNAQYPSLGLGLPVLALGLIIIFPIAGLCTGLVTATQRSIERGSLVGAATFGGSQLVLNISTIAELWMVLVPVVVVGAVFGAFIGAGSAAVSRGSSVHNHIPLEAGK